MCKTILSASSVPSLLILMATVWIGNSNSHFADKETGSEKRSDLIH